MTDTPLSAQTTGLTEDTQTDHGSDGGPEASGGWLAGEQRAFEQRDESVLVRGIDRASGWATARREAARTAITENPLGSAWVIFGAGVLAGLILARR
ncbi:MAG TPA: hypothetical protein VGB49_00670 [Caulobacteraceae bacterium]